MKGKMKLIESGYPEPQRLIHFCHFVFHNMCDYSIITHNINIMNKISLQVSVSLTCTHSHYDACFRQFSKLGLGNFFDVWIRSAELSGEHRFVDRKNNNKDLNLQ